MSETRVNAILLLDEVVLAAYDESSYAKALKDISVLCKTLREHYPHLEQGTSLSLPIQTEDASNFMAKFRVLMCLPVMRGQLDENTRVIITRQVNPSPVEEHTEMIKPQIMDDSFVESMLFGNVDVTSTSLSTTLGSPGNLPDILEEIASDSDSESNASSYDDRVDAVMDALTPIPHQANIGSRSRPSRATTLSRMTSAPISCYIRLLGHDQIEQHVHKDAMMELRKESDTEKHLDMENIVLLNLQAMSRAGILSGNWVGIAMNKTDRPRYCRAYAYTGSEAVVEDGGLRPTMFLSPRMAYNIGLDITDEKADIEAWLTRTSYDLNWCLPVANTVNLSRVVSPLSSNRSMVSSYFEALTNWLQHSHRAVRQGDIISVDIVEERARVASHIIEIEREMDSRDEMTIGQHIRGAGTSTVYFKVTQLDCEDAEFDGTARIVADTTRVTQTGTVQSRVPYMLGRRSSGGVAKRPSVMSNEMKRLYDLLRSGLHPLSAELGTSCAVLLSGARGSGKRTTVAWVTQMLGLHLLEVNCHEIVNDSDAKTEVALRTHFERAIKFAPCVFLLKHIGSLAKKSTVAETGQESSIVLAIEDCLENLAKAQQETSWPTMVVATTDDVDALSVRLLGCFPHRIEMQAPDEEQRRIILEGLVEKVPLAPDVSISTIATQTAAFVAKDLKDIVQRAALAALARTRGSRVIQKELPDDIDLVNAGVQITGEDFEAALGHARSAFSDSIGAPKIPNVTWDDVGGLASVKREILDTIQLPLEHPELFASGVKKRSGVLFYGPPGTGKTLLAKAVATSCSLNFFSVKGPELLNMYIGESEANVRRVFQRARDARPCVIFFDELDSVAPKRGEKGDSGGVMDRIVSQLLAELDGMADGGDGAGDVFVIGATNRPDLLDPALLRPGRFDKLLYLGISEDHESQLNIVKALTRKFRLSPDLDLRQVVEQCPFNYTGADFYALCSDAMLKAMSRTAESIEARVAELNANPVEGIPTPITVQYYLDHIATEDEVRVEVCKVDFDRALSELVPSVSQQELEHYKAIRDKFQQSIEKSKSTNDEVKATPKKEPISRPSTPRQRLSTERLTRQRSTSSLGKQPAGASSPRRRTESDASVNEPSTSHSEEPSSTTSNTPAQHNSPNVSRQRSSNGNEASTESVVSGKSSRPTDASSVDNVTNHGQDAGKSTSMPKRARNRRKENGKK